MDTREVLAQDAVAMLERIAPHAAPRNALKPTKFPAGTLYMQMYRTPHSLEERSACIAEGSYFIAMRRGFSPGHELDDWLTAENEVDTRLMGAPREY
jgi:Protein of unknown function (DUF2934)